MAAFLQTAAPHTLWDIGANNGDFSRIAARQGIKTIAFDIDPCAVNKNYLIVRNSGEKNLLPLLLDLTNPSPAIGWAHTERLSLAQRVNADAVMALALIHHLAIGNNLPLNGIAAYFASLGKKLIIEFVSKEDSKTQLLLAARKDIFSDYTQEGFENAFRRHFSIERAEPLPGSCRTLYLMCVK